MKSKGLWLWLGVLVVIVMSFLWKYNTFVTMEEGVSLSWAQVENQYQRRADLIPNIVNSVKWEATFEKSTLEAVVEARASATKTNVDVNNASEIAEFQQQQEGLSQALSRLLMVVENYPDLKSNAWFADLRVQLEGTENRISVERKNYNDEVRDFNVYVRVFPNNLVAAVFGFEKKSLFESTDGADQAPDVEFNFQ